MYQSCKRHKLWQITKNKIGNLDIYLKHVNWLGSTNLKTTDKEKFILRGSHWWIPQTFKELTPLRKIEVKWVLSCSNLNTGRIIYLKRLILEEVINAKFPNRL